MAKNVKQLKDPRTCRVFFSSPFGGMEAERDELMRKYFPQLQHLCLSRGVEFVPVDMRWGVTAEAAARAQTVTICLREVDRCDMFVGFYGQRYGWHGSDDKLLQRNIDVAVTRYPWLRDRRDVSVTELEFLHGHLNKPGHIPACFCFRDKGYDDSKAHSYEKEGDTKQADKFRCENAEAQKKLDSLRKRVVATKNKTIAVHLDYFTPEEGANQIFNAIWDHVTSLLGPEVVKGRGSPDEEELEVREGAVSREEAELIKEVETVRLTQNADHNKFCVGRQNIYIGGDKYFKQLDKAIGGGGCVVVTGKPGQGKSSLLANWVQHLRKSQPKHNIIYHFIGCSQFSDKGSNILQRLCDEIGDGETRKSPDEQTDISQLMEQLTSKLQKLKQNVVMVIDGLDKMEEQSKAARTLFWLPSPLPKTCSMVLSTLDTDTSVVQQLVGTRKYQHVKMEDLDVKQRKQICEAALGRWGKSLSGPQVNQISGHPPTSNPRFLNILVTELTMFGSFRQLDQKIASLLKANSTGRLCELVLKRLEADFPMAGGTSLVHKVLPFLLLSRQGLSENEVTELLTIPVYDWLPLFFALEQYIVTCSGLMRLGFPELSEAVERRYLQKKKDRDSFLHLLVKFFDDKRKKLPIWPTPAYYLCRRPTYELPWLQEQLGDKKGMAVALADHNVFNILIRDNSYVALDMWRRSGVTLAQTTDLCLSSYDRAVKQLKAIEQTAQNDRNPPAIKLMRHLENLYHLLELAQHREGFVIVCHKIINILEGLEGKCEEGRRARLITEYRYNLACGLSDSRDYNRARQLHTDVIQYYKGILSKGKGRRKTVETRLAWSLNGLGLVNYHQQNYNDAEKLFKESETLHHKHGNKKHEGDCQVNLGLVQLASNNTKAAVETFMSALKLYETVHYDSVPHTIGNVYTNLGLAYRRMGDLDEAEKHYNRSLEIKMNAVGEDHPSIATAYMNLGTVEMCRKNWAKMETYTRKAVNILKTSSYLDHSVELLQCQENLLQAYLKQGKMELATSSYWPLFDSLTKFGRMGQCLPWVHNTMARHLLDMHHYTEADRILTQLAKTSKKTAATFLYLDQLDQLKTPSKPRPQELTLEHGLKLYPASSELLKQKVLVHHIRRGDVAGAIRFWGSVAKGPGDFATLVEWCQEAGQAEAAAEVLKKALEIYPELG